MRRLNSSARPRRRTGALLAVLAFAVAASPALAPAGLAADVGDQSMRDDLGAVVLRAQGPGVGGEDGPLEVGRFLEPGLRFTVPDGARVVLLLQGGDAVVVGDEVRVPELTEETDSLFRLMRALLLGPRDAENARPTRDDRGAGAHSPGEAEGGGSLEAVPLRPDGDRRVRTLTPELVWRPVEDAQGYRVSLWSSDELILERDLGPDTTWVVPSESALSPGTLYTWAVTSLPAASAPGPRGRFTVASREILDTVARELGRLRGRGLDPERDGLLAAAALFRSMALPYDALTVLQALRDEGDPRSDAVVAFERRLRDELGAADPPSERAEAGAGR